MLKLAIFLPAMELYRWELLHIDRVAQCYLIRFKTFSDYLERISVAGIVSLHASACAKLH